MSSNKVTKAGHDREDRFKSVLVEDGHAARVTSAYIDLNPVRAGLVKDPKDYRWCSYGEAVAGRRAARAGLQRVVFEMRAGRTSRKRAGQEVSEWRRVAAVYRTHLFLDGRASKGEREGGTRRAGVRCPSEGQVRAVLASGGMLSEAEALRCRMRHLSDGLAIGSREFVNQAFRLSRGHFGARRRDGARRLRGVSSDLHSLRDLQVRVLG